MSGLEERDARLLALLRGVAAGELEAEAALAAWHDRALADLCEPTPRHVRIDLSRAARTGFPEVVYGEGKTPDDLRRIAETLLADGGRLLVTRADSAQAQALADLPGCVWHERARVILANRPEPESDAVLGVLCAGTTDVPVAEEAALTAEMMGVRVRRLYDVGVAGLHRLLERREEIADCDVLIVVAGLEGALPSVVGGLIPVPVIAVPTSVGYGAAFRGLSALLGMLSSCAPGVVAVNIDNGFGAGFAAGRWIGALKRRSLAGPPTPSRTRAAAGPAPKP